MASNTSTAFDQVFPIKLYCDRANGWSEPSFRSLYKRLRTDDLYAYGYDVVIHSPTDVELICFGLECNVYGGVGNELARLRGSVKPAITRPFIVSKAAEIAEDKRIDELRISEAVIVASYTDALLAALESGPSQ